MVSSFKDQTYCASPHCVNACGRQMSIDDKWNLSSMSHGGFTIVVSYGYFCGDPIVYATDDEAQEAGAKVAERYHDALEGLKDK